MEGKNQQLIIMCQLEFASTFFGTKFASTFVCWVVPFIFPTQCLEWARHVNSGVPGTYIWLIILSHFSEWGHCLDHQGIHLLWFLFSVIVRVCDKWKWIPTHLPSLSVNIHVAVRIINNNEMRQTISLNRTHTNPNLLSSFTEHLPSKTQHVYTVSIFWIPSGSKLIIQLSVEEYKGIKWLIKFK